MTDRKKNWVRIDKRTAAILKAKGFTISDNGKEARLDPELLYGDIHILQLDDGTLRLCIETSGGAIRTNVIDLNEEQLGNDRTIPRMPLRDLQ